MRVGLNYPWPWQAYGTFFGAPTAHQDPVGDAWLARWPSCVADNMSELRAAGIEVVRIFLACNGHNWPPPAAVTPPPRPNARMTEQLRELLERAAAHRLQIVPSFVDFSLVSASYEPPWGGGGGRGALLRDEAGRGRLLDLLSELLEASRGFERTIFAWEVMNEPSWAMRWIAPPTRPPRTPLWWPHRPAVSRAALVAFLARACRRIERAGFASTVGHRFAHDLARFPTGTRPQLHYYAQVYPTADRPDLPSARLRDGRVAFLGELAAGAHGKPWRALEGRDQRGATARVLERLTHAREKGFELALLWPDLSYADVDPTRVTPAGHARPLTWEEFTAAPIDPMPLSVAALAGVRAFGRSP